MNYSFLDIDYQVATKSKLSEWLRNNLNKYNLNMTYYAAIDFSCDTIKQVLSTIPNDLIFIQLSSDYAKNTKLKETLCECFNSFLVKNTACSFAIESYLRLHNGDISEDNGWEQESIIPDGAEPLTSDLNFVQGYAMHYKNIYFCFLPPKIDSVQDILDNKLGNMLAKLYSLPTEFIYFKTYGVTKEYLDNALDMFRKNSIGINICVETNNLDSLISIGYCKNADKSEVDEYVSHICETINKHIYATENISAERALLDYIKLTNKTISILETISLGTFFADLADCDSDIVCKNIVKHFATADVVKNPIINVDVNKLVANNVFSVESAYELAASMIEQNDSDISVVSLGLYGGEHNDTKCYLAIGDEDGIHIYKSTYHGNKAEVISTIKNNICFYLIRKLKQNELYI